MKLLRVLLGHQPADEKERAADEEQAHLHRHVVFQQAGEQTDREDDHPDELEEAAQERGHRRSVATAVRVLPMKPLVVLTAKYPQIVREILSGLCELVEHPSEQGRSEEEMITILSEADAAITLLSDPLTRTVLAANRDLRMIANYAVGYNNIDMDASRELGVTITNTPGVLTEATADLTMGLILAVMRRIVEGDREVRTTGQCVWEPLHLLGTSLTGKRLGIIGMGRIGSAVAQP